MRPWTEQEAQVLIRRVNEGASVKTIAQTLQRSVTSVRQKCRVEGIKIKDARNAHWLPEEKAQVEKLARQGFSIRAIRDITGKSKESIVKLSRRCGFALAHQQASPRFIKTHVNDRYAIAHHETNARIARLILEAVAEDNLFDAILDVPQRSPRPEGQRRQGQPAPLPAPAPATPKPELPPPAVTTASLAPGLRARSDISQARRKPYLSGFGVCPFDAITGRDQGWGSSSSIGKSRMLSGRATLSPLRASVKIWWFFLSPFVPFETLVTVRPVMIPMMAAITAIRRAFDPRRSVRPKKPTDL